MQLRVAQPDSLLRLSFLCFAARWTSGHTVSNTTTFLNRRQRRPFLASISVACTEKCSNSPVAQGIQNLSYTRGTHSISIAKKEVSCSVLFSALLFQEEEKAPPWSAYSSITQDWHSDQTQSTNLCCIFSAALKIKFIVTTERLPPSTTPDRVGQHALGYVGHQQQTQIYPGA